MSKTQKSDTETSKSATASKSSTSAEATVQAQVDKENAQGFRGIEVDPTPNENYTVKGVTSGAPTPETHAGAAEKARGLTGLSGIEAAERDKKAMEANAAYTRKVKKGEK